MKSKDIYRERRYSKDGQWYSWFEPCPVLKETPKRVLVRSQDFSGSPLYPGGSFSLDKVELLSSKKCYHSRHGDWFYLGKPRLGDLFPSADVMNAPSFVMSEAIALGWSNCSINDWDETQKDAWLFATLLFLPLGALYRDLVRGGESSRMRYQELYAARLAGPLSLD